MTCAFLPENDSRTSMEVVRVSAASESAISGGCSSYGRAAKREWLSSVATIYDFVSTPGEILLEEFLEPMGISQYRLAKAIGRPQSALSDIVHGRRAITAEMAWLLGEALGTTAQFWLNLETAYELKTLDTTRMPVVEKLAV